MRLTGDIMTARGADQVVGLLSQATIGDLLYFNGFPGEYMVLEAPGRGPDLLLEKIGEPQFFRMTTALIDPDGRLSPVFARCDDHSEAKPIKAAALVPL